jgi:D-arabinose 1-dehydrogenase-like Zn-dependent alcohol dehydrogenase
MMRAVWIEEFGGPAVLRSGERPVPEPGPGEVRVRVEVCGVCRHDVLTRSGAFPLTVLPVILGHQVAGVVDATGTGVSGLAPGDRVLSMVYQTCGQCPECRAGHQPLCRERPRFLGEDLDGGYAEYVVARSDVWVPLPDGLATATGAVLTCSAGTAYHAIVTRGQARAGETALVTGATGGVGGQALLMLRALGLRPVAVTRRETAVPGLRAAGAEHVIVAPDGRFRAAAKRLTGTGADLVIDAVGGPSLAEAMHSVRPGGRVVVLGNVEGGTATIQPALLILKEIALIGTKSVTREEMTAVLRLVADGTFPVGEVRARPLAEAAAAHREMELGQLSGRTVLVPGGSGLNDLSILDTVYPTLASEVRGL